MKKILGIMLVLSAFLIGVPHQASARYHRYRRHERVRVIYYRRPIIYRSYYSEPVYYYHPHRVHIHVPGVGANAGVGVGPIHIGAGLHLHEVMPPPAGPAADPTGINQPLSEIPFSPAASNISVDTISTVAVTSSVTAPTARMPQPIAYMDTNANNYFAIWQAPSVVTVEGFTVPVTGRTGYYSMFKHGRGGFLYIHNSRGVDATRDYGVSSRAWSIPQTIGGSGLPATPIQ